MAKTEQYPIRIGKVEKNKTEAIVVSIGEYKGKRYIDIRVHFKDKNDDTQLFPTKKGIAISSRVFEPIAKLMVEAYKKLEQIEESDPIKPKSKVSYDDESEIPEP